METIITVIILFPIYWMMITSFKQYSEVFTVPPSFWPRNFTLEGYKKVWSSLNFNRLFYNTFVASISTTALSMPIAILAGYSLSRLKFKGRELLGMIILGTYMFPGVLLIIPLFVFMSNLNLINNLSSLVIASTTFTLPFCIWMLRAYFSTIPSDLEDAARIDGCSRIKAIIYVILPLSLPGIAATSIFAFMNAWGNYMFALLFLTSQDKMTLPPALSTFITREAIYWNEITVGGVIATIPVIMFFLLVQKYIVQGLTAGGVKG
ncbi:MAG: carbohydrate ABC transporter permease [Saccharolobus sp.]